MRPGLLHHRLVDVGLGLGSVKTWLPKRSVLKLKLRGMVLKPDDVVVHGEEGRLHVVREALDLGVELSLLVFGEALLQASASMAPDSESLAIAFA